MYLSLPQAPDPAGFARLSTRELRGFFLMEHLFEAGRVRTCFSDVDRTLAGGAIPSAGSLPLEAPDNLASGGLDGQREIGIVNIGGAGCVRVGRQVHRLENRDALYIGGGSSRVEFDNGGGEELPVFFFVSYPAQASHPTRLVRRAEALSTELGTAGGANRRTIRKYLCPGTVDACQLTLGITDLEGGSIWNTMPMHRHTRRSEIYLYFDLRDDAVVFHFLGEPGETRHLVVRNRQAVVAPRWSIHSGAGTASYSFIWAMGGENRDFADMDAVPMEALA